MISKNGLLSALILVLFAAFPLVVTRSLDLFLFMGRDGPSATYTEIMIFGGFTWIVVFTIVHRLNNPAIRAKLFWFLPLWSIAFVLPADYLQLVWALAIAQANGQAMP